jgi:hypothetical protein
MRHHKPSYEHFYYHKEDYLRDRFLEGLWEEPPRWLIEEAEDSLKEGQVLTEAAFTRWFDEWQRHVNVEDCPGWVEFCEGEYESYYDPSDSLYEAYKERSLGL